MGYIKSISGFTCTGDLTIAWTTIGREYLIGKKTPRDGCIIDSFSLSDSDRNYMSTLEPAPNFIPHVTGDQTPCLLPTSSMSIKHFINKNGDAGNTIDYRSKPLKKCASDDCTKYYDIQPLEIIDPRTHNLVEVIWDCIVGDFDGLLI